MSFSLNMLIIAPEYFYPPHDGITVRHYNLFKSLSAVHRIDLLTFGDEKLLDGSKDLSNILREAFASVEIIPFNTLKRINIPRSIIARLKNIFFPLKITMGPQYYSHEMAKHCEKRLNMLKYDLVFLCGIAMLRYFDHAIYKVPFVVDVIDCPSLWLKSYYAKEKSIKNIKYYLNYLWAKRWEKKYLSEVENQIFVSPIDKEYSRRNCPKSNIWVLPNGVDTKYFKAKNNVTKVNNSLLFTGVMDYLPNHDSMIYFIEEILPLVRQEIPDITLTIAGKNPLPELQNLADRIHAIKLTGFLEDLRPEFDQSIVYVAPIVSGAGIKNKILEAWAMSKPVVASPLACQGLEADDGNNVLISDNSNMFAENIINLLSNDSLRDKLSSNGRKTVEDFYSWEYYSSLLENIIKEICEK